MKYYTSYFMHASQKTQVKEFLQKPDAAIRCRRCGHKIYVHKGPQTRSKKKSCRQPGCYCEGFILNTPEGKT